MPGIITSPMTAMLFSVGVSAAVVAERKDGSAASRHVAPRASASSTTSARSATSVRNAPQPSAVAVSTLPTTMPDTGTTYLASHGGLSARTKTAA